MIKQDEIKDLVLLIKGIYSKYDKDKANKITDNLVKWISSGSNLRVSWLSKIALGFEGEIEPPVADDNMEIKKNLVELYSYVADQDEYATILLDAAIVAGRSYDLLSNLFWHVRDKKYWSGLLNYMCDRNWSDLWIEKLDFCSKHIEKHKAFGYDLMSVFTYKHNPQTFLEICLTLRDEDKYRVPIDWLSDPYWKPVNATRVVWLYINMPGVDWGKDVVKSWMCKFTIDEIEGTGSTDPLVIKSIIDKWINVSPLLEYALRKYCEHFDKDFDFVNYMNEYVNLKQYYNFNGDDLAQSLMPLSNVPDDVMCRNEYYHKCVKEYCIGYGDTVTGGNPFNAASLMSGE